MAFFPDSSSDFAGGRSLGGAQIAQAVQTQAIQAGPPRQMTLHERVEALENRLAGTGSQLEAVGQHFSDRVSRLESLVGG
jgi:hypothetical protein